MGSQHVKPLGTAIGHVKAANQAASFEASPGLELFLAMWAAVKKVAFGAELPVPVLIGGNNGVGKTTLLYRAQTGELITTIPSVGLTLETLAPFGSEGPQLLALEVGGGCRIGPMIESYAASCAGIVFMLDPSDDRMYSALWELFCLVRRAAEKDRRVPVCVVVPVNAWNDDGTFEDGRDALSGLAFATLAELAQRDCLPPGGTSRWSPERRWAQSDSQAAGESEQSGYVDELWRPEWETDRRDVEQQTYPGGPGGSLEHLTGSHGMRVHLDARMSPPLATLHDGPWVVLPIDMHRRAADALLPFRWVAAEIRARR